MSASIAANPGNWTRYCRSGEPESKLGSAAEGASKTEINVPRPIRCRRCGQAITAVDEQTVVNGSFSHTFFNPAGIVFELGCYRRAAGCRTAGAPTDEFTWFPGFFWSYAFCSQCREHLGWNYTNPSSGTSFFGLILNRLRED